MPPYQPDKKNKPNLIVLNGELDFDCTKTPNEIYNRLRKISEEVGAHVVPSMGFPCHGGHIKVYPRFCNEYYIINCYEKNENPLTLRFTDIQTFALVHRLSLPTDVLVSASMAQVKPH